MGVRSQNFFLTAHWPTFFLIIGLPVFWLEMSAGWARDGRTTLLAWALMCFLLSFLLFREGQAIVRGVWQAVHGLKESPDGSPWSRTWLSAAFVMSAVILVVAMLAWLKPLHLIQEADALNYHYSLPRQHLIRGSFQPLGWSSADYFLMPIQTALAPFWFATPWPNKIPQAFFFFGLLVLCGLVIHRHGSHPLAPWGMILAILGSHGFGIQMGTAMLDLVLCYLAVAVFESLGAGRWALAAVEAAFLVMAKPFMPILITVLIVLTAGGGWLARKKGARLSVFFSGTPKRDGEVSSWFSSNSARFSLSMVLFCLFIGGPFLMKSWSMTGTPLYPLGVSSSVSSSDVHRRSLAGAAQIFWAMKNRYGAGRSLRAWSEHFWVLAVPEGGVNNRFDYPAGLPYLLFVGPFFFYLVKDISERRFPLVPLGVGIYWALWWMGSQQTRFLFIPLIFLMLSVSRRLPRWPAVLCLGLMLAVVFNGISLVRAHGRDLFQPSTSLIREKDLQIQAACREYKHGEPRAGVPRELIWPDHEVAFADCPVRVEPEKWPWVVVSPP